ncbi:MAG: tetratricopeptide repeat protein [Deltaproteobacteria bacterium]|nr:tetratricopeptide repeat protein [Deltaproteobacteria bacterium]
MSELADLAEGLRQDGKYSEARETLERCLEQSPRHPRALLLLGRLQYQEGKLPGRSRWQSLPTAWSSSGR